ncbi:GNAT family N-acetyltransferase [Aquisalibacillus elongatus]|uniref:Ribosomal-protein-alanine N-acetyltransferase n=1 Tax=Aquisalibacillus elongatus TaxID=485577 RepID=A0A3N5AZA4_9BACI|nr:GNAT family protein [Aquisalibacillus elongatus]RPF50606.1 ribosomal-protein-alanine N-acetyltransferase [Aquisalibacillus elongatus]
MKHIFGKMPTLETDRTLLRPIDHHDAEDMFEYASKHEVADQVTWPVHQTIEDTHQFIDIVLDRYQYGKVAPWGIYHKQDKKIIGTADFVWWNSDHSVAEIGYVLSPEYWGQGIVPEVVKTIVDFGFNEMNLVRIQAKCFDHNPNSERVMQKVGMEYEGLMKKRYYVKGEYKTIKIYAIVK